MLYNTMGSQLRTEERRSRQQCFEKAYEIRKAIADETGTFGAYRDLARVFENLGEAERKKANDEDPVMIRRSDITPAQWKSGDA